MIKQTIMLTVCCIVAVFAQEEQVRYGSWNMISKTVKADYESFYSLRRWERIGIAFGVGAVMANTRIDESLQTAYQEEVRSNTSDDLAKIAKTFGDGTILIPLSLAAASVSYIDAATPVATWGRYVARAYLVGAPALLATQLLTGASRPDEKSYDSRWKPFADVNGVSGHSFMGAVPFLVLSHMYRENVWIRYTLFGASFLTGLSRINDNDHYPSQAMLGWYLAYESVDAVTNGRIDDQEVHVRAMIHPEGYYGFYLTKRW